MHKEILQILFNVYLTTGSFCKNLYLWLTYWPLSQQQSPVLFLHSKEKSSNLDEDDNLSKYNSIKNELDAIYKHTTEGICIRSECNWYEHREKLAKFFMNLEKQWGAQNKIKKIMDQTHFRMNNGILRGFFNITRTNNCGRNFLSRNDIPKLSHEKKNKTLWGRFNWKRFN